MHRDDRRIAALATVPSREKELAIALESLRPQVDHLCVYLNGHAKVPECVLDLADAFARSQDHGDRGDGGKFYWSWMPGPAWYFSCDDDFEYKPPYARMHVAAAMRLNAAVSLHGVVLSDKLAAGNPCDWLREGRKEWYRAIDHVRQPVPVHILGTGVACHHTDLVTATPRDFPLPHSADIWFSHLCQQQGVRRFVWAHPPELAKQTAAPLPGGPVLLRRGGEYARRVAECAPWHLHTES